MEVWEIGIIFVEERKVIYSKNTYMPHMPISKLINKISVELPRLNEIIFLNYYIQVRERKTYNSSN